MQELKVQERQEMSYEEAKGVLMQLDFSFLIMSIDTRSIMTN